MKLQKYRWSRTYESAEEDLLDLFQSQNIQPERTVLEHDAQLPERSHEQDTTVWCAEGSIIITANQTAYSLQAGDALHIPAGTAYSATCGFSGCAYYAL